MAQTDTLEALAELVHAAPWETSQLAKQRNALQRLHHATLLLRKATGDLQLQEASLSQQLHRIATAPPPRTDASPSLLPDAWRPATLRPRNEGKDRLTIGYHTALANFETDVDAAHAILESAVAEQPSTAPLAGLGNDDVQSIVDFVQQVLGGLRDLAQGIAQLEGHALSALTSTGSAGHQSAQPAFLVLLRLISEGLGVTALRDFVVEICSAAVLESTRGAPKAREKELDTFILDVLDLVDALDLDCPPAMYSPAAASTELRSPLSKGRTIDDALLAFLGRYREYTARGSIVPDSLDNSDTQSIDSAWTNTLTSFGSLLASPLNSASALLAPNGFIAARDALPSPELRDTERGGPSPELETLLTTAATALLQAMASEYPLSLAPIPLTHAILTALLANHYPAKSAEREHRKLVVLLVIRWWAFSWLGRRLGRAGGAALQNVYISDEELTRGFLPLHRRVYSGLLEVMGFSDVRAIIGGPAMKELRQAARAAVQSFGILLTEPLLARPNLVALRPSMPTTRTLLLTPHTLFSLWDIAAPILFGVPSPALSASPPSVTTFKRRPTAGDRSSSTYSITSGSSAASASTEHNGPLQRLALALANLRSVLPRLSSAHLAYTPVFICDGPVVEAALEPFLELDEPANSTEEPPKSSTWRKGSKAGPTPLSNEDLSTLRRSVGRLVSDDAVPRSANTGLVDVLRIASQSNSDHPTQQAGYLQAKAVLDRLGLGVNDREVIAAIALPLEMAKTSRKAHRLALDNALAQASRAHRRALVAARAVRTSVNDFRLRAWWSLEGRVSLKMASIRREFRDGMAQIEPGEPGEGVHDFVLGDDGRLHRSLTLCRDAVQNLFDTVHLSTSSFWARESRLLHALAASPPSLSSGTLHSILTTPLTSFSFTASPHIDEHARDDFVMLPFGASTPSLATDGQSGLSPQAMVEVLTRMRVQVAGYLLADLHSEGIGPLSLPLIGADDWLGHSTSALPTSLDSARRLLRRFSAHPSPTVKLEALQDLVHVVTLLPPERAPTPSPGYFRRLSAALLPVYAASPTKTNFDLPPLPEHEEHVGGGMPTIEKDEARGADALLVSLERLLADDGARPPKLFANLQLLAALIPSSILDASEEGKAFWDTSLAALSWKQDAVMAKVQGALDGLSSGVAEDVAAARRDLRLAAREGNETAHGMLPSLGLTL